MSASRPRSGAGPFPGRPGRAGGKASGTRVPGALRDRLALALTGAWFRGSPWLLPLVPASWLFGATVALRRARRRAAVPRRFPVPVWVVGNLVVGGTGKTPLTLWIARWARRRGLRPGIVLRGYGGRTRAPVRVHPDADPAEVGDEALLLARRSGAPVVAGADRVAAVECLLREGPVDLVLSDDGLQHYRLHRDLEIVVFDGRRGAGNGRLLPAGPLREPLRRLRAVDLVVHQGTVLRGLPGPAPFAMGLRPGPFRRLSGAPATPPERRVLAISGIGAPERFFATLEALGYAVEGRPLADHQPLDGAALWNPERLPVVITEKDAVRSAARLRDAQDLDVYVLPVTCEPETAFARALARHLPRPGAAAPATREPVP